jgi:hypothetical protein
MKSTMDDSQTAAANDKSKKQMVGVLAYAK